MSRKDYVAIAKIIREQAELGHTEQVLRPIVYELCVLFKRDNSAFDVTRFRNACGVRA